MDDLSFVKSGKRVLQKAEVVLESCNTQISGHCLRILDWTLIFLILVTSRISEQFSNHDPTICLLRNKENITCDQDQKNVGPVANCTTMQMT